MKISTATGDLPFVQCLRCVSPKFVSFAENLGPNNRIHATLLEERGVP